jgi:hypothetical protein
MQLGWIGNRLLAAGFALFVAGYALMIAAVQYGNLVTGVGVVTVALGAGALCISPRAPFEGKFARFGLGVLAIGAAGLAGAAIIAAGMTFDPLESAPVVILGFTGFVLTPIGLIVTLLSLVRRFASSRS